MTQTTETGQAVQNETVPEQATVETTEKTTAEVLKLPASDATPEAWQDYYKQIGVPEAADKYELKFETDNVNQEFVGAAKEWFKEHGLLPHQAQGLASKFNAFQIESIKAQEAAQSEANKVQQETLKKEWGDKYDGNISLAKKAAAHHLGEQGEQVVMALESVLGFEKTIKLFHSIGLPLAEDSPLGVKANGGGQPSGDTTNPLAVAAKIMYGVK